MTWPPSSMFLVIDTSPLAADDGGVLFSSRKTRICRRDEPIVDSRCAATAQAGMRARRSELLGEEADQTRRQHGGVARGLVDRVARPVMPRARHVAGAREEARLLEGAQEGVAVAAAIDQVVLGPAAQQDRGLVVGIGGVIDRRGVEIDPAILHRGASEEILDIV